jgi:hypothetical protein
VAESQYATPEAKRWAIERLRAIDARGTTALHEGWLRGAEQVALYQAPEFINRPSGSWDALGMARREKAPR